MGLRKHRHHTYNYSVQETHIPKVFLRNFFFLTFSLFQQEGIKAGISENLLFIKWRESCCILNPFRSDSHILILFRAASSFVSVNPLAKKEGRVKLPEGDAGRRADLPSLIPRVDDRSSAPTLGRVWTECKCLSGLRVGWRQIPHLGNFI